MTVGKMSAAGRQRQISRSDQSLEICWQTRLLPTRYSQWVQWFPLLLRMNQHIQGSCAKAGGGWETALALYDSCCFANTSSRKFRGKLAFWTTNLIKVHQRLGKSGLKRFLLLLCCYNRRHYVDVIKGCLESLVKVSAASPSEMLEVVKDWICQQETFITAWQKVLPVEMTNLAEMLTSIPFSFFTRVLQEISSGSQ